MKYVIVDIDGTLSRVGWRKKFLDEPVPDWDNFYEACDSDEPIVEIINLTNRLSSHYRVVLCSGNYDIVRDEEFNKLKERWLL